MGWDDIKYCLYWCVEHHFDNLKIWGKKNGLIESKFPYFFGSFQVAPILVSLPSGAFVHNPA